MTTIMCPSGNDSSNQKGNSRLRPRLLNRFGSLRDGPIRRDWKPPRISTVKQRFRTLESPRSSRIQNRPSSVAYYEPLNFDEDRIGVVFDSSSSKNQKRVRFHEKATVVEIPNRHDFGEQSKKMWSSLREIKTNAKRNREEFHADGGDWRKCTEEDEMVFQGGKLMHPATYQRNNVHSFQRPKAQKKVVRASRVLTKHTLQKLLAERAKQPKAM